MRFEELSLPSQVLEGIRAAGFTECTPIQEAALPVALEGRDVAAQAQTGTGKTAVFLIAIFARMLTTKGPTRGPSPRALIVAPTRELVVQIQKDAETLGQFTNNRILAVYGGIDYLKQRAALDQGVDILIGTPGRLIDYLKQNIYSLKMTQFLVIDEADRMFDMGFISDLRFLLRRMAPYHKRQSMLFSATLSTRVMELCYEHMNLPERIAITPEQVTVETVEQRLFHVGSHEKPGLLIGLLRREPWDRIMVFVNTKAEAERLERLLTANGFSAAAITGDLRQEKRLKILSSFKAGTVPILVATDVASRGLHIKDVSVVVNYDLPQDPEDYVHRIGRTARAGASGKAVTFACEEYVFSLPDIEEAIKQKIPVVPVTDELVATSLVTVKGSRRRGGRPQRSHDRPGDGRQRRGTDRGTGRSGRPPRGGGRKG
jgi:ATP-dependent RNA helicase RhlB